MREGWHGGLWRGGRVNTREGKERGKGRERDRKKYLHQENEQHREITAQLKELKPCR